MDEWPSSDGRFHFAIRHRAHCDWHLDMDHETKVRGRLINLLTALQPQEVYVITTWTVVVDFREYTHE